MSARFTSLPLLFVCLFLLSAFAATAATEQEEALWDAARDGDLATVTRLVEGGLDVNSKTRYGATALAYACDKGHVDIVRYLIERGADVNTQDSFYEFSPIGWATFNGHTEILKLLLANGSTGADPVLAAGVESNDKELVAAALAGVDVSEEAIVEAHARALESADLAEILALLEATDIEFPDPEAMKIEIDEERLRSYTGTYKNADIGLAIEVRLEDGKLIAQATGQTALTLRPLSQERFEAVEVAGIVIGFAGADGAVERAVVEQGGQTIPFPKVTATAAAEPEAEEQPEPAPLPEATRTAAQHWPSFRGAQASGVADGQGAPVEWDVASGKNVLWKTPVPGIANSSPIVWGERVFVTTAISGADDDTFRTGIYGDVNSVEDESEHTFKVYALDRDSGEILWEQTAAVEVPRSKRHLKASQANSTPVTDGKRVVALFGTIGLLVAYDMDGKELWRADTDTLDSGWFYDKSYQWGHASSPVIYKGLVIVQADIQTDSYIAAWRLKDGKLAWRTERDEIPTWGTPTVYYGKKKDELVTNGTTIRGYDPSNGKELWTLGPNSEVTVGTPVVGDELIYVTAGYNPIQPIYAIKAGSRGDLTLPEDTTSSDAIAWSKGRGGTYMPTPIVYRDRFYTCANNGRLTAYDAKTGDEVFRARVGGGGSFSASPIAADGKLYFTSEDGDVIVIRAGSSYEELARNEVGKIAMSTPAISGGVFVMRTMGTVFGFAEQSDSASASGAE